MLLAAIVPGLAGCVQDPLPSASPQEVREQEITLPPPPRRALTVAIYNCIDTTGQRRPTGSSQELSSAVPMDCSPYLVEAIRSLTPGYIFLVERQHVDELLRERQLATLALNSQAPPVAQQAEPAHPVASLEPHAAAPAAAPVVIPPTASVTAAPVAPVAMSPTTPLETPLAAPIEMPPAIHVVMPPPASFSMSLASASVMPPPSAAAMPPGTPVAVHPAVTAAMPPAASSAPMPTPAPRRLNTLRVAEVLLIGQVVAYDRQTRQISGGAALAGIGGTGTVVTDLVTFSLRAVAVQTGEILGQSTVTKSITSQTIGGHLTKVWPTTILDLELGDGVNEPVGLALQESVRSSLKRLVYNGIHDGWWGPRPDSKQ